MIFPLPSARLVYLGALSLPAEAGSVDQSMQTSSVAASCDVSACSRAYASFHADDCTFQPFQDLRRLCLR